MWARHQAPARSSMIRSTDDPESARIQRPSRITPFYVSADTSAAARPSAIGRCLRRMRGGGRQLWSAPLKSRGSDEPRTIQFGNPVRPREWFLVPLSVLDEAFHCIKDGTDQPLGCFGRALPDRFRNDVDACRRAVRRTRLRGLWNRLNRGVARMAFDDRESAADRTGLARCRARDRRRRRDCRRSLPMSVFSALIDTSGAQLRTQHPTRLMLAVVRGESGRVEASAWRPPGGLITSFSTLPRCADSDGKMSPNIAAVHR